MISFTASAERTDKSLSLLGCCRPDGSDRGDKPLRAVMQKIGADSEWRRRFDSQAEFDAPLAASVQAVPLPEGLVERASAQWAQARQGQWTWRAVFRQPALLAVLLAVLFLISWCVFFLISRANGFPGDEAVAKLVPAALPAVAGSAPPATNARRNWLEPVSMECGKLGDTLFLAHGFDQFRMPPEFAGYEAVGFRVLKREGDVPVAKIAVRPHDLVFLIFRGDELGVKIKPAGRWKFLSGDDWAAAAQMQDGICFVAACRGSKSEIKACLQEAGIRY